MPSLDRKTFGIAAATLLAKWGLFAVGLNLMLSSLMGGFARRLFQVPSALLLLSTLTTAIALLSALALSPLRRSIQRSWAQFSWQEELTRIYARPFSWLLITTILLVMLALSQICEGISVYILERLPATWGIDTVDSVVKMLQSLLAPGLGNRLLQVVSICLLPAITEELFFRRGVQRLLIVANREKPIRGIIATSIIFGLVHFSLVGLLSRTLIGFVLGYTYYRTGRLSLAILLHFLNNLVSLISIIYFS